MKTLAILLLLCICSVFGLLNSFAQNMPVMNAETEQNSSILINQVGYLPNSVKVALLRVRTEKFEVVDVKSGKSVFQGLAGPFRYWDQSGDSVSIADFSSLKTPGKYQICVNNKKDCSYTFEIAEGIYSEIAKASLKAFYLNRSGIEIKNKFAGKWSRGAGHPDTAVMIHASAASAQRPEGFVFSSPGGWYDAGDYNKYIVNSAISTYTMLLFYQLYPEYCKALSADIPESGNNLPDVLDELLYNLRWMLTMQDPADGGVYHKLTSKSFCGFIMPSEDNDPRFVVMKSTAASLDFAATMAMASRVFKNSGYSSLESLADSCLRMAEKAFTWANTNPKVYYANPEDITTGAYDDKMLADEFFWAKVELALATGNRDLISESEIKNQAVATPSWDFVSSLGILSLSVNKNSHFSDFNATANLVLNTYADHLVNIHEQSPYHVSLNYFKWGSNSDVANQAIIKIVAYQNTLNIKYLNSVQSDVDYLLGRNATAFCFVTGFGSRQLLNIHHRPSGADGVKSPCPGFLAGGPNTVVLSDCEGIVRSTFPAKSFSDAQCSYSTNEIAINWNAPLFFALGSIDYLGR